MYMASQGILGFVMQNLAGALRRVLGPARAQEERKGLRRCEVCRGRVCVHKPARQLLSAIQTHTSSP
jgi:hypothetical protein